MSDLKDLKKKLLLSKRQGYSVFILDKMMKGLSGASGLSADAATRAKQVKTIIQERIDLLEFILGPSDNRVIRCKDNLNNFVLDPNVTINARSIRDVDSYVRGVYLNLDLKHANRSDPLDVIKEELSEIRENEESFYQDNYDDLLDIGEDDLELIFTLQTLKKRMKCEDSILYRNGASEVSMFLLDQFTNNLHSNLTKDICEKFEEAILDLFYNKLSTDNLNALYGKLKDLKHSVKDVEIVIISDYYSIREKYKELIVEVTNHLE